MRTSMLPPAKSLFNLSSVFNELILSPFRFNRERNAGIMVSHLPVTPGSMKSNSNPAKKTFLRKSSLFAIAFVVMNLFIISDVFGQSVGDYRSGATSFNWNVTASWQRWDGSTWVSNPDEGYPGQNSGTGNVLIQNTHTITITASVPNAIGCLTVGVSGADNAALTFNNIGNVNLIVTGNVNVDDGSFTVTNASGTNTHTLSIGGNLIVGSGNTFDMTSGGDDVCNVTFNGAANQTVSGAGTTVKFNLIAVNNSGTTNNNIVEILSTNFAANSSGFLTLTGGILKLSGNYTLSNPVFTTAGYTIVAGTGVWLNNPNVTVTGQASDVTLTGSLQVTAGNYIVGINGGRSLRYNTGSSLTLDGGTLTISQSFVGTNTSQTTTFNMSAGTLTVLNFASVNGNASFDISAAGSSFTMSGGTIILQNENTNGTLLDYRNIAGSGTITGGTVQFGTSTTPGSPTFNVGVSPTTNIFPSLSLVKAATSTTVTLSTPISVNGNVALASGTTLNANNQAISVTGNWTNNGTFTAGTGTVTFNGSGIQMLKPGGSSFRNILHNSTSTLRLTTDPILTTSGTFTNSAGIFDANDIQHVVSGLATISAGEYQAKGAAQTFNGNLLISGGTFTGAGGSVLTIDMTLSSGTLTAPSGTFRVFGNWSKTGGTFIPGSNTVTFAGNAITQLINSGGASFNNVLISIGGSTRQLSNPLTVDGTFTIAIGGAGGGFDANGFTTTVAGLTTAGSFGFYQAGSGTQTFNGGLTVSGGTFTGSSGIVNTTNVSLVSGTLDAPLGAGAFNVSGNWTKNSAAVFNHKNGTVTFNGTNQSIGGTSGTTFNNLTLSNSGTKTFGIATTVNANLSINTGVIANLGTFTHSANSITLGGEGTASGSFGSSSSPATIQNDTYFALTTGIVNVGNNTCTNPTIILGTIPAICAGATSFTITYTGTTGNPNQYSISGTGITPVINAPLGSSPITVNLNSPATAGSIPFTLTVRRSTTGCSGSVSSSVTANAAPNCSITGANGPVCPSSSNNYTAPAGMSAYAWSLTTANGATIVPGTEDDQQVTVIAGSGCNAPFTLSLTITSANGCSSTCSKTVNVNDTENPTVATAQGNHASIGCNPTAAQIEAAFTAPTFTDNCGGPTVTVSTAHAGSGCAQSDTRTWTATDGCGHHIAVSQTISYTVDTEDPTVASAQGNNAGIGCNPTAAQIEAAFTAPIFADNCGDPTVNVSTAHTGTGCAQSDTRTWTASDGCGHHITVSQTISYTVDTEGPTVASAQGNNASIGCNPTTAQIEAAFTAPAFADNCDELTVTVSNTHEGTGCAQSDTRTWTATDGCGHHVAVSQTISYMMDTEDPTVASAQGNNASIGCNPTAAQIEAAFIAPTFTDNCDELTVTVSTTHVGIGCAQSDTRTWTATDGCGNDIAVSQTISYTVDTEDPTVASAQGNNASIGCNPTAAEIEAAFTAPTFADNCGDPTVIVSTAHTGSGCIQSDKRTWTATDGCGHYIAVSQTISYTVDTEDPTVASAQGNNASIGCNPTVAEIEAAFTAPTFADNCDELTVTVSTVHAETGCTKSDTRTWTAIDGCNNEIAVLQTISYKVDTEDPTVVSAQGNNASIGCNPTAAQIEAAFTAPIFADNCGDPIVTVSTAHAGTACAQSDTRTWAATDGCGHHIAVSQTITYTADTEGPTVIKGTIGTCYPTVTAAEVAAMAATAYMDNCTSTADLIVAASTTGTCNAVVHVTVTDGCGNSNFVTYNTRVDGTKPVVTKGTIGTCYKTQSEAEAAAIAATTSTDNCPGSVSISANTIGDCNAVITVTVTDGCGNNNSVTYNTSIDNILPTVTFMPADVTVNTDNNVCQATNVNIGTPTVTDNCSSVTITDDHPSNTYPKGTTTVTWTIEDACHNKITRTQHVTVEDHQNPAISCKAGSPFTRSTNTGLCTYKVVGTEFDPASFGDNCPGATIANSFNSSNTLANAILPKGTNTIVWTVTDASGHTATCSIIVKVEDHETPTITCPGNITITGGPNTATWTEPTGSDNCPGWTVSRTGPAPGSAFATGVTNITYTVTDASGNQNSCSFTVTNNELPVANCTNSNPVLYFGYSGDQTAVITATPTTGTAPFTVKITMNRPLLCNQVNDAGDEVWTGGSGGTTTNNTCPANPGLAPVSINTIASGSYTVTVTLMADADITVTITDAGGSVTTCTTHIHADDVRCFAGNSGNSKITICHQTGSVKNPCVKICVDADAVNEHLAHGDFLGKCTPDCTPPAAFSGMVSGNHISPKMDKVSNILKVNVLPNPTATVFNLMISSNSQEKIAIAVLDMHGRKVYRATGSINQQYKFGSDFASGVYILQVIQGKKIQTVKLIKGKG